MNMYARTNALSVAAIAVTLLLSACDGGGSDTRQIDRFTSAGVQNDPALALGQAQAQALALAAVPAVTTDLVVRDFSVQSAQDNNLKITAGVDNLMAQDVDMSTLSLALEFSMSGDFSKAYRTAIYDITATNPSTGSLNITGRANKADLPSGLYYTRVVVNPDWKFYFDNIMPASNHFQSFRYLTEADYTNNASQSVQMEVSSHVACTEDPLETPVNGFNTVELAENTVLNAALCLDDADIYRLNISAGNTASVEISLSAAPHTRSTRYLVVDPDLTRQHDATIEYPSQSVSITAEQTGSYYVAVYGARAEYRISRNLDSQQPRDWFFINNRMQAGPTSWLYGNITLTRLAFDQQQLIGKTVSCSRFTTSLDENGQPLDYATPSHFPLAHSFHFNDASSYTLDGTLHYDWSIVGGDIYNAHWYDHVSQGWAENTGEGGWRYWDYDGRSYIECGFE